MKTENLKFPDGKIEISGCWIASLWPKRLSQQEQEEEEGLLFLQKR